jgi:hypothetical protein
MESNHMTPTHATVRLNSYTTLDNLEVAAIDYTQKIVTLLIPFSGTEKIRKTFRFTEVESFVFPTCVNELA